MMPRPADTVIAVALTLAFLLAAADAHATLTRTGALGGGADYLEDDAAAMVWYAALLDYPDQAVLALGDYDHDADGSWNRRTLGGGGALHAALGPGGDWATLGVYAQEDLPEGEPGGGIDLLAARRFGRLGLALRGGFTSYSRGANSTETDGSGESLYYHSYGVGARWDMSDDVYADLAGEIVNVQGDAAEEDLWRLPTQQTWSTWGLRTRWFVAAGENLAIVPLLDYRRDDRQAYDPTVAAPADRHAWRTTAGVGFDLLPDGDNLVVVSAEYRQGRQRHDRLPGSSTMWEYDAADLRYKEIHVRVGLESRVLAWLTLRGGLAYQRLQRELRAERGDTLPDQPDRWYEDKDIDVLVPVTLGLGLHLGAIHADVLLNGRHPATWGTFPFGPTSAEEGTFTSVTVGYDF
jgi:hypothetical protein